MDPTVSSVSHARTQGACPGSQGRWKGIRPKWTLHTRLQLIHAAGKSLDLRLQIVVKVQPFSDSHRPRRLKGNGLSPQAFNQRSAHYHRRLHYPSCLLRLCLRPRARHLGIITGSIMPNLLSPVSYLASVPVSLTPHTSLFLISATSSPNLFCAA
jgi:hypothetical protein